MTSRFREELANRDGPDRVAEAVRVTVGTAGRAVFFSGLTVLLGLLGLVLFEFMILRSVGIAGAIVVGLAVASALTLLPAILAVVGTRIDRLAVRRVTITPGADGPWARLARRVMRHPVAVLVPTLSFLLLLGVPFLHVRFNAPDSTILPPSVPSREAYDILAREFGEGEFAPLALAIRTTGDATTPDNIAKLYDYSRRLAADPRVNRVVSLVDVDPRLTLAQYQLLYATPGGPPDRFVATALGATTKGDLTAFTVYTRYGPNRDEGRALVHELRDPTSPLAPPAGVTVLVGGGAADVDDVVSRVWADFPRTALFIVVTTFLVLFALLRSVVLPIKALVMNTLSIVASFGALVWIFQDGNLSAALGFQPLGFVETTQPVILFCVLFGLSMDYEVFLLTRMKEVWDRTHDNTEAVARGLERSGRIITSAALIVIVVAELVRVRRHRPDQGPRDRHRDRGRARRHRGPRPPRPRDDAAAGPLELVDAGPARPGDRPNPAADRSRRRGRRPMRRLAAFLAVAALAASAAGCGGPVLANPAAPHPVAAPTSTPAVRPPDPQPVVLPAADAPHDRLTEWWYDTGHLRAEDGRSFGFELVVFRAERGGFPVSWASHLALTDETGGAFHYAQRSEIGPQVDRSSRNGDAAPQFAFEVDGARGSTPWTMAGGDGTDELNATAAGDEVGGGPGRGVRARPPSGRPQASRCSTTATAGSTSAPRAARTTTPGPTWRRRGRSRWATRRSTVEGDAWFDHQWGDFISVGAGGWDWFAVNLDDGTDLTLSLVRAADGTYPLVYGTLVDAGGRARHLDAAAFTVDVTDHWTSPSTGADLPGGLARDAARRAPRDRPAADRPPSRSSTRGRRPGACTGRGTRS